jgi:peptidoglycan/LPS O-acetylase OafA/YrhL
MKYRSEIDGLRTLAVLPVVLFHAGFSVFSGGFIGVDIFFVISGYLITTILIRELEESRFSILRFYERRFRRILPALFVVIAATIPLAWLQLDPLRFKDFSKSIIATMAFVSNILFWRESGYFDTDAENKPLLHTWSLAVEEQYYLFFPIMLFLFWRYGRRSTLSAIVLLTIVSFALCLWGARHHQAANFYLLPTRMWELFAGSICAFAVPHLRGNQWLSALGFALIVAGIFGINGEMRFPDWITLAPVLGASLIILFARSGTLVAKVLSLKPMVWIGLISYSLYLWHQPLLAFARLKWGSHLSLSLMLGLVGLSLILAVLTWRFVEQPFRGKRAWLSTRAALFGASLTGMIIFSAFGFMGIATKGAEFRSPPEYAALLAGMEDKADETCQYQPSDRLIPMPREECDFGGPHEPIAMLLMGDSHAWALSSALIELAQSKGLRTYVETHTGCIGLEGILRPHDDNPGRCIEFGKNTMALVEKLDPEALLIAGRFALLYHSTRFDNFEGGIERDKNNGSLFAALTSTGSASTDPDLIHKVMLEGLLELSRQRPLFIVEPIPEAGWNVPMEGMRRMPKTGEVPYLSTSYARYHERNDPVVALLREVQKRAEPGRVHLIRVDDLFCHEDTGRCDNIVDGVPLYFDDDHLSNAGARRIAPRIIEAILTAKSDTLN